MPDEAQSAFPRPFFEDPWPARTREAARALWRWHLALLTPPAEWDAAVPRTAVQMANRAVEGKDIPWIPPQVSAAAYEACAKHGLERTWLALQVQTAPRLWGGLRVDDQSELEGLIDCWAVPHAQALAKLADAAHRWQLPYVSEFARGLFLVGRLMQLSEDVGEDRIFIPLADLEQAGVSIEQLKEGRVDESMRRLLWKQIIRARDALAHGAPLANEVSPRFARALKRWWMGALEILSEIERRDYDVWSRPVSLSMIHRLQVRFQAQFGRTTFRGR